MGPNFSLIQLIAVLLLIQTLIWTVQPVRIQPTLFKNNRIYALQNQHSGNYLTAGKDGELYRTPDRGTQTIDQLWKVMAINREGFKLLPLGLSADESPLKTVWKPIYLGFGNYLLQNSNSESCLEATANRLETPCDRENNLYQLWFPTMKDEDQLKQILGN